MHDFVNNEIATNEIVKHWLLQGRKHNQNVYIEDLICSI